MDKLRKLEILNILDEVRNTCHTDDPFEIANHYEIEIYPLDIHANNIFANTYYRGGANGEKIRCIVLNNRFDEETKRVLCAHELGHCLLGHPFKREYKDKDIKLEYEANLFAVGLLFEQDELPFNILDMTNYALDTVLNRKITKLR